MTSRIKFGNSRGFGAILAAILLFVICVIGLALLATYAMRSSQRTLYTGRLTKEVYQGLVGNPQIGSFGYLGDAGGYPGNINALLSPGTNGPYVRDVGFENGVMMDEFYSPLEYWRSIGIVAAPATHGVVIISRGPDHVSSNTSASPNDATVAFVGTNPASSGYITTPDNVDNMVTPDIFTSSSAINVGYTGTLTYNVRNYDIGSSQFLGACPAAYTVEITSDTRGAVNETILGTLGFSGTNFMQTTPTQSSISFQLVQGLYTMRLLANSGTNQAVYTESVAVYPGSTTTRWLTAPSIDTTKTPNFTLRVTNYASAQVWIRQLAPGAGSDVITAIGKFGASKTASVPACGVFQARGGAGGTGAIYDTWLMTNANMSWGVSDSQTFALSVTQQTTRASVVQIGNPGLAVGSTYLLRQKNYSVPVGVRAEVLTLNGTLFGAFGGLANGGVGTNPSSGSSTP